MFDEQNQNPNVPKNLPTEPVDMFAGVEKNEGAVPESIPDALSAGLLKKKDEASLREVSQREMGGENYKMSAPILGKILFFTAAVLLLGGLAYGGWWLFYDSKNKTVKPLSVPTNQASQDQTSQNASAPSAVGTSAPPAGGSAQINNDQILFGQAVDSDKDGLDDVREKEIGSDPQKIDTDGDGLSDGDEVIVYKTHPLTADTDDDGEGDGDEVLIWRTNPLNPDTDGDGYSDGEEVRNGYSPLGPGKLFNLPATTTAATSP